VPCIHRIRRTRFDDSQKPSSRQCRAQQALAAAQSVVMPSFGTSCTNAGVFGGSDPGGFGGLCGTDHCDGFCEVAGGACTGANGLFDDLAACRDYCSTAAGWSNSGSSSDNSIQCRLPYVRAAALQSTNCAAVSLLGGNVCGTQCVNYCANRAQAAGCNEMNTGACEATCAGYTVTGPLVGFGGGDNLQCYNANAVKAAKDGSAVTCTLNQVCPGPQSSSSRFSSSSPPVSSSSSPVSSSSGSVSSSSGDDSGNQNSASQLGACGVAVALVVAALF